MQACVQVGELLTPGLLYAAGAGFDVRVCVDVLSCFVSWISGPLPRFGASVRNKNHSIIANST